MPRLTFSAAPTTAFSHSVWAVELIKLSSSTENALKSKQSAWFAYGIEKKTLSKISAVGNVVNVHLKNVEFSCTMLPLQLCINRLDQLEQGASSWPQHNSVCRQEHRAVQTGDAWYDTCTVLNRMCRTRNYGTVSCSRISFEVLLHGTRHRVNMGSPPQMKNVWYWYSSLRCCASCA